MSDLLGCLLAIAFFIAIIAGVFFVASALPLWVVVCIFVYLIV